MAHQHFLAMNIDYVWVGEDSYAGFVSELLANHEVTVPVHKKDGYFFSRQLEQSLFYPQVMLVGIVIANPGFEQIAEYVKCVRVDGLGLEEAQELVGDIRPVRFEVKV